MPNAGQSGFGAPQYGNKFDRPSGSAGSRMQAPQPVKKKRSILPGCLISILIVVVVLLGAAEFGTRWFINTAVKTAVVETAAKEGVTVSKDDAEVSFGRSSVLVGFVQQKLSTVNIKTPSTMHVEEKTQGNPEIVGTPKMDIRIKDFGLKNLDDPKFGQLDLGIVMTDQNLLDMMQTSAADSQVTGAAGNLIHITQVTTNESQGTVDVQLTGGLATIRFKPSVADGNLKMDVENVDVVGISLGDEVARALGDQFSSNAQQLNNGMKFTDVQVKDGELDVGLHGTDVTLSQLQNK